MWELNELAKPIAKCIALIFFVSALHSTFEGKNGKRNAHTHTLISVENIYSLLSRKTICKHKSFRCIRQTISQQQKTPTFHYCSAFGTAVAAAAVVGVFSSFYSRFPCVIMKSHVNAKESFCVTFFSTIILNTAPTTWFFPFHTYSVHSFNPNGFTNRWQQSWWLEKQHTHKKTVWKSI